MTERLSLGSVILPTERGSAVLTFNSEGEEGVFGLHIPGFGYGEVRADLSLSLELRERFKEVYANALVVKTAREQAEKDEARVRRQSAAMDELIALSADEF